MSETKKILMIALVILFLLMPANDIIVYGTGKLDTVLDDKLIQPPNTSRATSTMITAVIDGMIPPGPVHQKDMVAFKGHGDNSSHPEFQIVNYQWNYIHPDSHTNINITAPTLNQTAPLEFNLTGKWIIEFRVWGSDGSQTIISEPDSISFICETLPGAPVAYIDSITPNPAAKGEPVTFKGHGTDIGGAVVAYGWSSNISGLIDAGPSSNTATNSSLEVGVHKITFVVMDFDYYFSAPVNETLVIDSRPILTRMEPDQKDINAFVGDTISFNVTSVDNDFNTMPSFSHQGIKWYIGDTEIQSPSITTTEDADTLNSTLSLDITSSMLGVKVIKAVVSDGILNASWEWNLHVSWNNHPPKIEDYYPSENPIVNAGTTQRFSVNISDTDPGDMNNISISWKLDGKEVQSSNVIFDYSPTPDDIGNHTLNVTVLDWKGGMTGHEWDVSVVEPPNLPPTIIDVVPDNSSVVSITEGEYQEFRVTATDPENPEYPQAVQFKWYVNDKLVSEGVGAYYFQSNYTGYMSNESSPYTIKAVVTDGVNDVVVEWTLIVKNKNRAPIASIGSPLTNGDYVGGDIIRFDCTNTTDPDNDHLTFTWTSSIDGLIYNGSNRVTTESLSPGKHVITLQVSDGQATNETSVVIVVKEPVPDIRLDATITPSKFSVKTGELVKIRVDIKNMGMDDATDLQATLLNNGIPVGDPQYVGTLSHGNEEVVIFDWTAVKDALLTVKVGNYTFNVTGITVSDGSSGGGSNPSGSNSNGNNNSSMLEDTPLLIIGGVIILLLLVLLIVIFLRIRRKSARSYDLDDDEDYGRRKKRNRGKKGSGRYADKSDLKVLDQFTEDFMPTGYNTPAIQPAQQAQMPPQAHQASLPPTSDLSVDAFGLPPAKDVQPAGSSNLYRDENAAQETKPATAKQENKKYQHKARPPPSRTKKPSFEQLANAKGAVGDLDSLLDSIFASDGVVPENKGDSDLDSLMAELGFKDEHITIHCPKCKANIIVDYTVDDPIRVRCDNCGATGRIKNPWKDKKTQKKSGSDLDSQIDKELGDLFAK